MWTEDLIQIFDKLDSLGITRKKSHYEKDILTLLPSDMYTLVNGKYHDVVYKSHTYLEFKKQSNCQWFDLKKLTNIPYEHLATTIVFFIFNNSIFTDIRTCTYQDIIYYLDITIDFDWKQWARCAPKACELKYPIRLSELNKITHSILNVRT